MRVNTGEAVDGGGILGIGRHHVILETAPEDATNEYGPQLKVKIRCLASTDPTQVDRVRSEFIPLDGKSAGIAGRFLVAVGAITEDQWKKCKEEGEPLDFDESVLGGRQAMVEVELDTYAKKNGKDKDRIGFNWYAVTDKRVVDWPKEPSHAAMLGVKAPAPAAAQPQQPAAGQPAAQPAGNGNGASAPAADDAWANFA